MKSKCLALVYALITINILISLLSGDMAHATSISSAWVNVYWSEIQMSVVSNPGSSLTATPYLTSTESLTTEKARVEFTTYPPISITYLLGPYLESPAKAPITASGSDPGSTYSVYTDATGAIGSVTAAASSDNGGWIQAQALAELTLPQFAFLLGGFGTGYANITIPYECGISVERGPGEYVTASASMGIQAYRQTDQMPSPYGWSGASINVGIGDHNSGFEPYSYSTSLNHREGVTFHLPLEITGTNQRITFTTHAHAEVNTRSPDPDLYSSNNVPLPGAIWFLGSGLAGLVAVRRKFKN